MKNCSLSTGNGPERQNGAYQTAECRQELTLFSPAGIPSKYLSEFPI